jgi:hypothetical protein
MEDVLDLYAEPYDAQRPQVCLDERPCQLLEERVAPLPLAPGQPRRVDYAYERAGTCNLFMLFEPLGGWRNVKVTERRTKVDFAHCLKDLVDVHFPQAQVIRVVLDNLNTHTLGALYEAFPAEEARRIARKLEFHFTPLHGSWLNMAEIELSILSRQCLRRRLPDLAAFQLQTAAWQAERNAKRATVHWAFSTSHARTKLVRLYPS